MSEILNLVSRNAVDAVEAVRALINSGVPIMSRECATWCNSENYSPMHFAVYYKNQAMIRLLAGADRPVERRYDITLRNVGGFTPIEMAYEKQFWDSLIVFTELSSDTNDLAGYRNVVLKLLRSRQRLDLVRPLLERVTPNITGQYAIDIVRETIATGNADLIAYVVSSPRIGITPEHTGGFATLAVRGDRNAVIALLQRGARPPADYIQLNANENNWVWVRLFIENLHAALRPLQVYQELLNTLILIAIQQVDDGNPAVAVQNRRDELIFLLNRGATCTQALQVGFTNERWHHLNNTALAQRDGLTAYKAAALLAFRKQWNHLTILANVQSGEGDAAEYGVAMVIAAYHGQLEIAQMLLANGARLQSTCGIHATTAMYGAIKHWQISPGFLQELVQRDATLVNQVISQNPLALYPIQFAFSCTDKMVLKFLLENGATPFPNANGELLKAATSNRWPLVREFFDWSADQMDDPSVPNLLGELLLIATVQKAPDQVEWLLRLEAPKHHEKDGLTPIQRATELGEWDVISVYTNFPAGENDRCRYGHAFLRLIQVKRIPDALALLRQGASTTQVTTSGTAVMINNQGVNQPRSFAEKEIGYSALHYAVLISEEYPRLLTALLEHNANINLASNNATTPLQLALEYGKATAVKKLMQAMVVIRDGDLNQLQVLADNDSVEKWAVITAFIENDAGVRDAKYAIYHGVLKMAILKGHNEIVPLLRDRLIRQLPNVQDSLNIVYAARLKRWDIVRILSVREIANAHHTARDYLLAAFLAIRVGDKNELAHHLLEISHDQAGSLRSDELVITGFEPKHAGYNALMFAMDADPPNHPFAHDYRQSQDYPQTVAVMGERYMQVAFAAKNKVAVTQLSQEGIQADLKTLMHASKHQNWECVVEYLKQAIHHRDCTDILTELFLESHRVNNVIDQLFLQQMMVAREVQPQVDRNQQQNRKIQQACMAAIVLFTGFYMVGLLDETQLIACLTLTMTMLWIVLSTQHPDHKAVIAVQNTFDYARAKLTAFTIWSKETLNRLPEIVEAADDVPVIAEQEAVAEIMEEDIPNDGIGVAPVAM